jgi:phosphotransferase system enzyme I (PtsP)
MANLTAQDWFLCGNSHSHSSIIQPMLRQGSFATMSERSESDSRKLLRRLRDLLAVPAKGQDRLDRITHIIADSMKTDVCSIYLYRDAETLELCATEGLKPESVHKTRMKMGEGLVGRVAKSGQPVNTENAPSEKGFRFMPETGEEILSSFLGVPACRRKARRAGGAVQTGARLFRRRN